MNSLGKSLLLPYTLMSLVLDFSQMILAVRNHLNRAISINMQNPEQQIIMQFFETLTLWGCPFSCPTPWCLWGWTSPRRSWLLGNLLIWPLWSSWSILNNHYLYNFSENSLSGEVLALTLHLSAFGAGLHPDGTGWTKYLKMAFIMILNNP